MPFARWRWHLDEMFANLNEEGGRVSTGARRCRLRSVSSRVSYWISITPNGRELYRQVVRISLDFGNTLRAALSDVDLACDVGGRAR